MTFESRARGAVLDIHRAVEVMEMTTSTKEPRKIERFDRFRDRKHRNRRIGAILVAGVLVIAGIVVVSTNMVGKEQKPCTSENATKLTGTLTVKSFAFSPDCFSVASGSTISVVNEDPRGHNFTVEDTDVAVPLPPGETGEATAPAPGTYDFECTIHPGMEGTIIVT